jgi:hypothetical protein
MFEISKEIIPFIVNDDEAACLPESVKEKIASINA